MALSVQVTYDKGETMGLLDGLKKQVTDKIQESIPDQAKPYLEKAEEMAHDFSEKKARRAVELARTKYILPSDIEKDLASGISYAKCQKKLRLKKGFELLDSKELDDILFSARTRISAERDAKQYEKDFKYYKISTCPDACSVCKKLSKKTFSFEKRKIGINFPPLHKGCRCTITIEENWSKWMDDYEKKNKKK